MTSMYCPPHAFFFGFAGVASAMILSTVGAAYGTAKAGIGISGIGLTRPELIMKSLIPVVMSGIIAVYGLVVAVLIVGGREFALCRNARLDWAVEPGKPYSLYQGYIHLAAGLACGGTGMAAGHAIGIIGDSGVRMYSMAPRVFVSMVLMLIFAEVIGLYGLITALILNTSAGEAKCF